MSYQGTPPIPSSSSWALADREAHQQTFVQRVYGWMAGGLLLTAIVSAFTVMSPTVVQAVFGSPLFYYPAFQPSYKHSVDALFLTLSAYLGGHLEYTFETALGQALSTSSSHHVQLLRDVDTLREVLSGGVITSLMDVPWTPIFLAMCFLLHPLIGLVALIGAMIILTLAFLNERVTKAPLNDKLP